MLFLLLVRFAYEPPPENALFSYLIALSALLVLRLPRWGIYGVLALSFIVMAGVIVFGISNGAVDATSDRDEGVEIAAAALLGGDNAWNERTMLDGEIATGPTSILLAIPSVALTGTVNPLTYVFWLCMLAILLYGDAQKRNGSFLLLFLLFLMPETLFLHTMNWSLEELYYPTLLFPVLWWTARRRLDLVTGVIAASILLVRPSYAFPLIGFVLWSLLHQKSSWISLLKMGVSTAAATVVILLPFLFVGGADFFKHNFWRHAVARHGFGATHNVVLDQIATWRALFPDSRLFDLFVIAGLLGIVSVILRRIPLRHPFWHMALGALLAHTIAFTPKHPKDYMLTVVIPAFFAVAFRDKAGTSADAVKEAS